MGDIYMKVLVITKSVDCFGGIERVVAETVKYMRRHFNVKVFGLGERRDSVYRGFPGRWVGRIPFSPKLFERIVREPADVILIHCPNPLAEFFVLLRRILRGTPYVVYYHNDVVPSTPIRRVLWFLYAPLCLLFLALAAGIVATSPAYPRVSPWLRIFRRKVVVVHNAPFNEPEFYEGPRERCFLFAGRLVPYKGVEYLLRGFALFIKKHPDWRLKIIGKGPLEAVLKRLVVELGIAKYVDFMGSVPDDVYVNTLKRAWALVLPSVSVQEGFGLVLLEAMSVGTLCLGSRISAIPYILGNGERGILFEPKNPESIARALEEAAGSVHVEKRRRAFEWVKKLSWERSTEELISVLRACASGNS